ncbi:MAG: hypothetical protein JRI97_05780, partial [Deltaproteobacteria bacterium]|nr:hypothetical protein [Deltaproteobacteria bacterium]
MRQYTVDQLTPQDVEKIKNRLEEKVGPAAMDVYWIPMDPALYSPAQK